MAIKKTPSMEMDGLQRIKIAKSYKAYSDFSSQNAGSLQKFYCGKMLEKRRVMGEDVLFDGTTGG